MPRKGIVDPANELTIKTMRIGPWNLTPKGSFEGSGVVIPRPGDKLRFRLLAVCVLCAPRAAAAAAAAAAAPT